MRLMMMEKTLRDLSGTRDFAAALAEQERALGLVLPPTLFDSILEPEPEASDRAESAEFSDDAAAPLQAPPVQSLNTLLDACDPWGNTILGAPGPLGQVRIRSARDGRELHVCGEAASKTDGTAHLWAWDYDNGEQRFVCSVCWGRARAASAAAAESAAANDQTAITETLSDEVTR